MRLDTFDIAYKRWTLGNKLISIGCNSERAS